MDLGRVPGLYSVFVVVAIDGDDVILCGGTARPGSSKKSEAKCYAIMLRVFLPFPFLWAFSPICIRFSLRIASSMDGMERLRSIRLGRNGERILLGMIMKIYSDWDGLERK